MSKTEFTETVSPGSKVEVVDSNLQVKTEVKFNGGNTVVFVDQGYGYVDLKKGN